MNENKLYEVALTLVPKIGNQLTKQLISYLGSPKEAFNTPKGKLLKIPGIGSKIIDGFNISLLKDAEKIVNQAIQSNTQLIFLTDETYPARLKRHDDAPALLYFKGNIELNPIKTVGIVGTRNATDYGQYMVEKICEELCPHSPVIVSGLAYGIDILAHRQALQNGLSTIGVMANGIDTVYPSVHKKTASEMIQQGGVLSENTFGAKPDAPKFPARNRIIAGLSDVVIVVEAAAKGGALITAEISNSYNIETMAVPGQVDKLYSAGCNKLIKEHKAHIYTSIQDLENLMNWNATTPVIKKIDLSQFSTEEQSIIELLQVENKLLFDEIARKTQVSISKLSGLLLSLELQNAIRVHQGGRYSLSI